MADRNQRRSMGDAMMASADKLAFIRGESVPVEAIPKKPEPKPVSIESNEPPVVLVEQQPGHFPQNDDRQSAKPERRAYRSKTSVRSESENQNVSFGFANLLVPLTTRLQPSTAAALKRAGLERKLSGQQPSTVQEIVEVAIQDWLRENKS